MITNDHPKLKGYAQHGVVYQKVNEDQAIGTCPFCHKPNKFYTHVDGAVWDCKVCITSGNFQAFMKKIYLEYVPMFEGEPSDLLRKDRMLRPQTFRAWDVGFSGMFYSIPVRGLKPESIVDILRYNIGKGSRSTTGAKKGLIVPKKLYESKRVYLCEGEWDAMAMWECLRSQQIYNDVYGAPGAGALPNRYGEWFFDKDVVVLFDNDEAGIRGAQRVGNVLEGYASTVEYLHWPKGTPDKYDIKDLYFSEKKQGNKVLNFIKQNCNMNPPRTVGERAEVKDAEDQKSSDYLKGIGISRDEAISRYREWLHLPNPECIDVLFGSVFANRIGADPLWMFLVAPPGGSKSELLMSLSDAPLIITTTSLTPAALVSGQANGAGDPSLLPKLNGKLLVIKDFTTILSKPIWELNQILGVLRDAYDGEYEQRYGNAVHRKYKTKFGIMAGVTLVIEGFQSMSAVLGERFLKYKIGQLGKIIVGTEVIRKTLENLGEETQMRSGLREIAKDVLNRPITFADAPAKDPESMEKIIKLSQWISSLRGVVSREKYTGQINFKPMAEIGTRLAKQLYMLAMGISIFKQEDTISESTYQTIVKVGRDTAPDRVEEIVRQLYLNTSPNTELEYATTRDISDWTRFPEGTVRFILQDLDLLSIVKKEKGNIRGGWRLSASVTKLIQQLDIYKKELEWTNTLSQRLVDQEPETVHRKIRKIITPDQPNLNPKSGRQIRKL